MAQQRYSTPRKPRHGRLRQTHHAAHATTAPPADSAPAPLPSPGEIVDLGGVHGTCAVLGQEPGLGGITMVSLRCTKAGRRTTPGETFKLSEPMVRRLLAATREHDIQQRLSHFWGMVGCDLAQLGPSSWLVFLGWFLTITEEQLPPTEEPQQHEGFVADLSMIHKRVLRGFLARQCSGPAVTFTVTLDRNGGMTVSDDLPMDEIRSIAQAIQVETDGGNIWLEYRRFVAGSMMWSAEIAQTLVQYVVDHQQRWLRTGKPLDHRRLARSSQTLINACGATQPLLYALVASIGRIRVGDRELEFESLFTASDFERNRVVTVLSKALMELGVRDLKLLTLYQRRDLRRRAEDVLNEGMPDHLRRPMGDDRFREHFRLAAAQVEPTKAAVAGADRAFTAEADELRLLFREHRWRHDKVAEALGITPMQLVHHIQRHRDHRLGDAILEERRAFVLEVYRKTVPGATTAANMEFVGIRAVARAIGVEPATPVGLGQHVEGWIRDALVAGGAPRDGC